ncbi:MAG: hypothetical protein QM504_06765 [Pseudomonadota bacterium]
MSEKVELDNACKLFLSGLTDFFHDIDDSLIKRDGCHEIEFGKFYDDGYQEEHYEMLWRDVKVFNKEYFGQWYACAEGGDKCNSVRIYTMEGIANNKRLYRSIWDNYKDLFIKLKELGFCNESVDKDVQNENANIEKIK